MLALSKMAAAVESVEDGVLVDSTVNGVKVELFPDSSVNGVKEESVVDSPTSVLDDEDGSNEKHDVKFEEDVLFDAGKGDFSLIPEAMVVEEEKLEQEWVREEQEKAKAHMEAPVLNDSQFTKLDELLTHSFTPSFCLRKWMISQRMWQKKVAILPRKREEVVAQRGSLSQIITIEGQKRLLQLCSKDQKMQLPKKTLT